MMIVSNRRKNCFVSAQSQSSTMDIRTQRSTLESFYHICDGENWIENTNWDHLDYDICSWYGVVCAGRITGNTIINGNGEQSIVALKLQENNLNCTLPAEIFMLPFLEVLDVGKNSHLVVDFDLVKVVSPTLRTLVLEDIGISSTAIMKNESMSNFIGLESLVLAGNELTGPFPTAIATLVNLKYVDLSFNFFTGTLPDSVANLIKLEGINLSHNSFTGQISTHIGNLINLDMVDFSYNTFTGSIPSEMNKMKRLSILSLNDQANSGISGPLIDFAESPNLNILNLARNDLTGTVPESLLLTVDENSFTTVVDLSANNIQGFIPSTLDRFFALRIYVIDNEIEGIDPELCAQRNWFFNEVNFFGCNAILCPPSTSSMFGRQTSLGLPCENCPNGLDDAPYYGSTSCRRADNKYSDLGTSTIMIEKDQGEHENEIRDENSIVKTDEPVFSKTSALNQNNSSIHEQPGFNISSFPSSSPSIILTEIPIIKDKFPNNPSFFSDVNESQNKIPSLSPIMSPTASLDIRSNENDLEGLVIKKFPSQTPTSAESTLNAYSTSNQEIHISESNSTEIVNITSNDTMTKNSITSILVNNELSSLDSLSNNKTESSLDAITFTEVATASNVSEATLSASSFSSKKSDEVIKAADEIMSSGAIRGHKFWNGMSISFTVISTSFWIIFSI